MKMPTIELKYSDLCSLVGKRIARDRLQHALMMMGVETEIDGDNLKLEVLHNRPDMLSPEGVARALAGFLGMKSGLPKYTLRPSGIEVVVKRDISGIRPFIAAGVVRRVKLRDEIVASLMQVQEKLHTSLCRGRRKGSIGVYDLDTIAPPIRYSSVGPHEIKFIPLDFDGELTPAEILKKHPKGIEYRELLKGFKRYPMLSDSRGRVLSMPPIINSEETKVREKTRNLFIDVTGTDETLVNRTLVIMMTALAERGFKLESVKVRYPGRTAVTPNLAPRKLAVKPEEIRGVLNLPLKAAHIVRMAKRMRYGARVAGGLVEVLVPPYRTDVLHKVDLIEDLAIGYGYDRISPTVPKVATIGERVELERTCEKTRLTMVGLGFTEVMTYTLTSPLVNFRLMRTEGKAVEVANPVSEEYTILRTSLLPSLLQVLKENRRYPLPQMIFEIGDVVLLDPKSETGAKDERRIGAAIAGEGFGFARIRPLAEALLREIRFKFELRPLHHPSFIDGRCGEIVVNGEAMGVLGEVHPEVLIGFGLQHPVSAFEISLEPSDKK